MEKADLIEPKELLQSNEKSNRQTYQKKHTASVNIEQNASKHIESRKKKLAHSSDQS